MRPEMHIKYIFITLIVCLTLSFASNVFSSNKVYYLDQGWTDEQRKVFYETPQGSYLIPLKWYLSLEQKNRKKLFSRRSNIQKFNYIIKQRSDGDVRNIPLGFAIETVENEENWLGYSCAACHTNEITHRGKRIRIDGAPTLANFSYFVSELHNAVIATLENEHKFSRFARRVIGSHDPILTADLFQALTDYAEQSTAFSVRNHTTLEYGYGRLDAFGIIMNELFADDLHVTDNAREPNGPVSYPFLWGTPQHDFVQWNGGANNPIGRNVGEVLGTFGAVNLSNPATLGQTSARGKELILLENLISELKTPYWPEEFFGHIHTEQADRGRVLYQQIRGDEPSCENCHALKDANGIYPLTPPEENFFGAQFVITKMISLDDIGTDRTSSENFATRIVSTGALSPFLPPPFTGASELPAPALLSILVGLATQSSIASIQPPLSPPELAAAIGFRVAADGFPPLRPKNILAYRARPLDGIWATAPYLHNGSVQNLYELLKPGDKRKTKFHVGSRKFDAKRVGFKSKHEDHHHHASLLDTTIPSNSNLGHEYGTSLTKKEKWDLIEFLKTL